MAGDAPKEHPKSTTGPPPPPPPPRGERGSAFLSGEGDADLLERRNDRLRQVLGLGSLTGGGGGASGSGDGGRRRTRPVIEVVAAEEEGGQTSGCTPVEGGGANDGCEAHGGGALHGCGVGGNATPDDSTRDGGRSSDDDPPDLISPEDDGPPPLAADESLGRMNGRGSTATGRSGGGGAVDAAVGTSTGATAAGDGPSLMDEMLKDAGKARAEAAAKSKARERKAAKDASFGNGMKKGFLSSSRKKKTKGNARRSASSANTERKNPEQQPSSKQPSKVNSSLVKSTENSSLSERSSDEAQTTQEEDVYELDGDGNIVKPKRHEESIPTLRPRNKTSARDDADRLVFEEVQEAMRNNPLDKLNDARDVWATPDLMEKIAGNPRLAAGMANPKYTAALEALQRNPKDAMAEFRHHPDIVDFLNEFCSVMGEHFTKIGAEQDKSDGTPGNVGPLAQEAIRRQEKMRSEGGKEFPLSREEKERVDAIVADEELSHLLMDPDMQRILQECGRPGRMGYFMQHPDHGPKLRKLIDAGLFKIEQ